MHVNPKFQINRVLILFRAQHSQGREIAQAARHACAKAKMVFCENRLSD